MSLEISSSSARTHTHAHALANRLRLRLFFVWSTQLQGVNSDSSCWVNTQNMWYIAWCDWCMVFFAAWNQGKSISHNIKTILFQNVSFKCDPWILWSLNIMIQDMISESDSWMWLLNLILRYDSWRWFLDIIPEYVWFLNMIPEYASLICFLNVNPVYDSSSFSNTTSKCDFSARFQNISPKYDSLICFPNVIPECDS